MDVVIHTMLSLHVNNDNSSESGEITIKAANVDLVIKVIFNITSKETGQLGLPYSHPQVRQSELSPYPLKGYRRLFEGRT